MTSAASSTRRSRSSSRVRSPEVICHPHHLLDLAHQFPARNAGQNLLQNNIYGKAQIFFEFYVVKRSGASEGCCAQDQNMSIALNLEAIEQAIADLQLAMQGVVSDANRGRNIGHETAIELLHWQ